MQLILGYFYRFFSVLSTKTLVTVYVKRCRLRNAVRSRLLEREMQNVLCDY